MNLARLEHCDLRYSVTPAWIHSLLDSGVAGPSTRSLYLHLHRDAFSSLLPLLRHDALEANVVPPKDPCLAPLVGKVFQGSSVKRFVSDARRVGDDGTLSLRSMDVCLRAENPLTSRFVPPPHSGVRKALGIALVGIDSALGQAHGDPDKVAICAMLGAQALLTIHPFKDGNGRTARMFMAAKVLRHLGPAPTALLGMLLLHRSGGHQYHQAAWALRAGDAEPMVDLFIEAERLAYERFIKDLPAGDVPAGFLAECRDELRMLL